MKVAFQWIGHDSWIAGGRCLSNLVASVLLARKGDPHLCAFGSVRGDVPPGLFDSFIEVPASPPDSLPGVWRSLRRRILGRDLDAERALARAGTDVVGLCVLGVRFPFPHIGWIPDFQHRHFPDMFSARERRKRDRTFRRISRHADRILVISDAARRDAMTFLPIANDRIAVVPPYSMPSSSIVTTSPEISLVPYAVPDRFLFLPAQFWKHKNHATVLHAIHILRDRGVRATLVCTGLMQDHRHPDYCRELLQKIREWDLESQVILLGPIPHEHVFQLMRKSLCVVSASLFEGFGMVVDEADGLGKTLLISDIPPHREQGPASALFFDPWNAEEAAEKIRHVWEASKPGPDPVSEAEGLKRSKFRVRQTGEAYWRILEQVSGIK